MNYFVVWTSIEANARQSKCSPDGGVTMLMFGKAGVTINTNNVP